MFRLCGQLHQEVQRRAGAKQVYGVKAVANDLEVKLPSENERLDPDIAKAAVQALESRFLLPHDQIKMTVRNGWITLEGNVKWYFQKESAESAVRDLKGVKGVTNLIMVKPPVSAQDVKAKVEDYITVAP